MALQGHELRNARTDSDNVVRFLKKTKLKISYVWVI